MNIRNTTVPLPIDSIKEYFNDKSIFFMVDYENSKLQDTVFLTYLANLDIPSDIVLRKDYPKEKLFALLDAYMNIKTVCNIPFLEMIVVHMLLQSIGVDTDEVLQNKFLSNDDINEYVISREETVGRWITFVHSSLLYLIYSYKELNNAVEDVSVQYPVIDEVDFIGHNVVKLFSIEGFYETFLSTVGNREVYFFEKQFKEYMFKGKSFFEFYNTENNIMIPILLGALDGSIPVDPVEVFGEQPNG
jgi:hypothetical protein